jgi:hypothetical protein
LIRTLAVVLVVAAGLAGLLLVFSARDEGQIEASPTGPGELQPDDGARHVPGREGSTALPPVPPTSGPHYPEPVTRERRELTADQIIHALELGNVVMLYDARRPPAALERLQQEVAGPFDAELAAAGQAVILAPWDGAASVIALAWRRVLETDDPARLRDFADAWLGEGVRP